MGFIEEEGKRIVQEKENHRIRTLHEEHVREENSRRIHEEWEKERAVEKEGLRAVKEYLEQSQVEKMAQELIDMGASIGLEDVETFDYYRDNFEERLFPGDDTVYRKHLILDKKESGGLYKVRYINIAVSRNGDVVFEGEKTEERTRYIHKGFLGINKAEIKSNEIVPYTISIGKETWQANKCVLETALGNVYGKPHVYTRNTEESWNGDQGGQGGGCY